jgi:hypothetical protein
MAMMMKEQIAPNGGTLLTRALTSLAFCLAMCLALASCTTKHSPQRAQASPPSNDNPPNKPDVNWCAVTEPLAKEIPHGDVEPGRIEGNTATVTVTVGCAAGVPGRVRVVGPTESTSTVPLRPDGSVTSHITLNGVDGNVGLTFDRSVTMTVASTLSSTDHSAGALHGTATLMLERSAIRPIDITGNVVAPKTAPNAVLNMTYIDDAQSNLRVNWSWSTTPIDYGSKLVPANYIVGLFISNRAGTRWSAFRVDDVASPEATWAERIERFRAANAAGGVRDPASRVFENGEWCVTMGAARSRETRGLFIPAPNAAKSCVLVTPKEKPRRAVGSRGSAAKP